MENTDALCMGCGKPTKYTQEIPIICKECKTNPIMVMLAFLTQIRNELYGNVYDSTKRIT